MDKQDNYSLRISKYLNLFVGITEEKNVQFRCKTFFKPGRLLRTQKKVEMGERLGIGQPRPVRTYNDASEDTGNEYELQPFVARMPSIQKRLKEVSAGNYFKRKTEHGKQWSGVLMKTEESEEREGSVYRRFKKTSECRQGKQATASQFRSEKSIFLHQILSKLAK